jgi:hypothetical protein
MYLRNHADAAIFLNNGRDTVEGLEPGDSHRAEFEFEVRERPEDGTVQLEAIVYDSVFREYLSEKLTFAVGEEGPRVRLRPGRTRASEEPVDILAGASDAMPRIAVLPAGGTLPVTATTEGWLRVEWEGGSGWVRATELELDDPIARPPSPVTEFIVYRPPLITFEDPPLRVDADHLQLRGDITDDTLVRDYYVVVESKVSDVRSEALKITYEYLGAQSARFDASVPLRPGPNQITVFARDGDEMRANESIFVYRDE